jgi:hypothetical protein
MNEKLNDFMNNMGLLCETWVITYNNFIQRGLTHKVALEHTKAFMSAFMESAVKNSGGEKTDA